ncbi:MAG TPA: type 4a pilus biogenesis protein PilO [Longimicrobiaceae bacterium]|nr:type 4a pilus biogenesis protein PilO [Longimicrobiaceae bacterium]
MAEPLDPRMRQRLILGALVVALLGYGGYRFLYRPEHTQVQAMETRLEKLETANRTARALSERQARGDVERRLVAYRGELEHVEGLIPSSEELPDLLDAISAQARRTGVDLSLIQPTGATAENYYVRRTYDLAVLGTYHQIARFLTETASLARIVTPTNLNVTVKKENDGGDPQLEAKFTIETYVLPVGPLPTDTTHAK